jgi:light-regulated signal transduction histidine kinase (bacteriophytochrome)
VNIEKKSNVSFENNNREYSELEVSNKELEAFCYAISHDLRVPLFRAKSYCSEAIESLEDETYKDSVQYMNKASQIMDEMNELISDLLRLSKIQQKALEKSTFDMSKMATRICEQLNEDNINKVDFYICPDIKQTGDSSFVQILLENLLSNAWKYSQKSKYPRVELGVSVQKNKNVFYIKDNGVGFDMHYVYKLFTPFQRLHSKKDFEGTGIGLATSKRIVHRHGGRIWAEGSVDQGATFYFTLD